MIRAVLVGIVLVGLSASAQEIGTEISGPQSAATPTTTTPQTTSPNDNPYATVDAGTPAQTTTTGTTTNTSTSTNKNAKNNKNAKKDKEPVVIEGGASAREGAFGIRGSFGASSQLASSGNMVTLPTGAFGLAYWASDAATLLFDVGGAFALINSNALWGATVGIGLDYHFMTPAEALRPFFHVGALATIAGASNIDFGVTVNIGFGADYFLTKQFALTGRLNLSVPMTFPNGNFNLLVFTAAPAVGAAWYF